MLKSFFSIILLSLSLSGIAQSGNLVKWKFSAKKISATKYELHMTANLPAGWHIYSQNMADGGPEPTKFTFAKNALVANNGKPKEVGKMIKSHDENFGIDVKYYSTKVDFVQTVTLKGKINTNVSGDVYYMICNDSKCLPPTTTNFNIALK
ncbi:protein-disulfide reductase DsbD domain-containing protein [Ferruginibacter sp. SUN002]|uniref:protein-disulfide reductase DsbD domain-containing protein n=1 Tax=Ferruginibacter sp. SUN002 TaxID=2937789 RepID=UPI003D360AC8